MPRTTKTTSTRRTKTQKDVVTPIPTGEIIVDTTNTEAELIDNSENEIIVTDNQENVNLTETTPETSENSTSSSLTVTDEQKQNIILTQAKKMDVVLFEDDVKAISNSVSSQANNQATLILSIQGAIVSYQRAVNDFLAESDSKFATEMQKLKTEQVQNTQATLAAVKEGFAKESEQWQQAANHAMELFKFDPETFGKTMK